MNTAAKAWVKALESGKFSQTKNELRDHQGYCCLGVACELAAEAGIIGKAKHWLDDDDNDHFSYAGESLGLPPKVQRWLGLADRFGKFKDEGAGWDVDESLTNLNDDKNYTFKKIAALIKTEPEGLFRETRKATIITAKGKTSGKKQKASKKKK